MAGGIVQQLKAVEKKASVILGNMIRKGIKDLPQLISNLEKLHQTHFEFEYGDWVVIIDKPVVVRKKRKGKK